MVLFALLYNQLSFLGPQLEHVPPEDSKDCIAVSNLLETGIPVVFQLDSCQFSSLQSVLNSILLVVVFAEMREPAREAAGSTCENNILCNADEKKVEEEIDVCPALVEESQNHVVGIRRELD